MNRHHALSLFLLFSICLLLASCTSVPLEPRAKNIKVISQIPSSRCRSLGHVTATDTSGITIEYASHEEIQKMQINSLKNQAAKLGANVVVITLHTYTHGSPIYLVSTGEFVNDPNEFSHQMSGVAYWCPGHNE